jgi:hypothetical protein
MEGDRIGSGSRFPRRDAVTVAVRLDQFGAQALRDEAAKQGVPVEQLAAHAVMYYLADLHSGRITRNLPPLPESDA